MMKKNVIASLAIVAVKSAKFVIAFLMFLCTCLGAKASATYVTFNNGVVYVFPDSCIADFTSTTDSITFTGIDGKVFSYSRAVVSSVSQSPIRELPTITSFKFNNKYNYQVVSDAQGVISNDTIIVEVIGIGKRLTEVTPKSWTLN